MNVSLLLLLLVTSPLAAQTPTPEIDFARLGDETAQLLAEYIRINTTNLPGHELAAARWLHCSTSS